MKSKLSMLLLLCVFLAPLTAAAQESAAAPAAVAASNNVPNLIKYSGVLKDSSGRILTSITGVTFLLYRDEQGGAPLWMESQNVQPDKAGRYNVQLGAASKDGIPTDLFMNGDARWLEVQAQGQERQPRVMLLSVPYAMKAGDAQTVGGLPVSAFVLAPSSVVGRGATSSAGRVSKTSGLAPGSISGSGTTGFLPKFTGATTIGNSAVFQSGSFKIGINTITPTADLDVNGTANVRGSATVKGNVSATGVVSARTYNIGSNPFAFGSLSTGNAFLGFSGNLTTTGGANTAIGDGALGLNTSGQVNTATGVSALAVNTTGPANTAYGAGALDTTRFGDHNTGLGYLAGRSVDLGDPGSGGTFVGANAVPGKSNLLNATAIGTLAEVDQSNSLVLGAINGVNNSIVDTSVGIGTTAPISKLDVDANVPGGLGPTVTLTNKGGSGQVSLDFNTYPPASSGTYNPAARIVAFDVGGFTDSIAFEANTSGNPNSGLRQTMSITPGGDVTIQGQLAVVGEIFAGVKDFRIDHPLDPANKYLYHASVESSEMMNIYTGNVTTDAQGEATVQLPEWFEALNTDFRYQLTVIGQFAQAIVAHEIQNRQFAIRTNAPNVKVSWQVAGVRQDAYAKAHPLVVEEEKNARERGFYLHPELHGAAADKGIAWIHNPATMQSVKAAPELQKKAVQSVKPVQSIWSVSQSDSRR